MSSKAKDKQLQELVVSAGIQYRVRPVGLLCTEDQCHLLDTVEAISTLQEVKTRSSACWTAVTWGWLTRYAMQGSDGSCQSPLAGDLATAAAKQLLRTVGGSSTGSKNVAAWLSKGAWLKGGYADLAKLVQAYLQKGMALGPCCCRALLVLD